VDELKLPELGENIDKVEVSAVLVKTGQRIERDQPVIEVETEKASLEVPATTAGVVRELLISKGDTISVGQVIARVERDGEQSGAEAEQSGAETAQPSAEAEEPHAEAEQASAGSAEPDSAGGDDSVIVFPAGGAVAERRAPEIGSTVPAAPSTRRLAREIGVDIGTVRGSGPGGRISRSDVKSHAKRIVVGVGRGAGVAATAPALPDLSEWGEVERRPLSNVRRVTARAMATAWAAVPHVTQFDRADVTELESLRRRFNDRRTEDAPKLTMTALVVTTVAAALRRFPDFNASLDLEGDAVVYRNYVHVGVAVDTERGLLVPVIRDVDRKGLLTIAAEMNELAGRARQRKLSPDEMKGAGFTVSNLGGLGTTYFSPIVNWPQVAILGVGRAERLAVYDEDDRPRPRLMLPLSVSYDHRLIDGADAARFARWIAEALEQPLLLLDGGGDGHRRG